MNITAVTDMLGAATAVCPIGDRRRVVRGPMRASVLLVAVWKSGGGVAVSKPIALHLPKSWSRALVAAACCGVAIAAASPATAEDSVINIMNKDWAEKNAKAAAAQPPAQSTAQAQSAVRAAPAAARSSVR